MPKRPYLHHVRHPARHDKCPEKKKHPMERQVAPLSDEPHEHCRNREVRQSNRRVRNDVKPNKIRVPEVAISVRAEISGAEYSKKIHSWLDRADVLCCRWVFGTKLLRSGLGREA